MKITGGLVVVGRGVLHSKWKIILSLSLYLPDERETHNKKILNKNFSTTYSTGFESTVGLQLNIDENMWRNHNKSFIKMVNIQL